MDGTEQGIAKGQLQLVIGSFSQSIGSDRLGKKRQQFQLLRVFARDDTTFVMQRTIFERKPLDPFIALEPETVRFQADG